VVNGPPSPSAEVTETHRLRRALGTFATGVTVVTVGKPAPHGMTANSFTSVSLDPPLVLVCVRRDAIMHRSLNRSSFFGVSVLAGCQEPVARHFADSRRARGAAQFDAVDWRPGRLTGVPLISGALAGFECELWRSHDGGDHTIFVGRLLSLEEQADEEALLFFGGRFRHLISNPSEVTT
jgi:flavin reductase (DIM6/NTAB) family NADH-FMN oxidoreductase RutF